MTLLDRSNRNNSLKLPELLAPAGSIESFWAAVESGADAVYIGVKGWNARAFAGNFSLEECADLISWAETKNIKIHLAVNSLLLSRELDQFRVLLERVADLAEAKSFGGLIVQDMGAVFMARRLFPEIPLHLSTLSGIHNLQGVERAAKWGIRRVVLAREVPVEEAIAISEQAPVEIEVFVHGALCFSFSGFCLASSFRGGRSGLRGECAQPCRLRFRQGKREGFFLSCSDFSAIDFIPRLKKSRIAALKIEGRMKSPDYVANVVKAYRMVLSASPGEETEAIGLAKELLRAAPSRHTSAGFWEANPSERVLDPGRSGSSGIWIATVESRRENSALLRLRGDLRSGDIVRPESWRGREEPIRHIGRTHPENAQKGDLVEVEGLSDLPVGTKLFLIGHKTEQSQAIWKRIRSEIAAKIPLIPSRSKHLPVENVWEELPDRRKAIQKSGIQLLLKISSPSDLPAAFHSPAKWVVLKATLSNLESLSRMKILPSQKERLVLSLPTPELGWTERLKVYKRAAEWLVSRGFLLWEINNPGHLELFRDVNVRIGLFGGMGLNVRNAASLAHWAEEGCFAVTLSPEMTRDELRELMKYPLPAVPVVTVFSWLPLMTSVLEPKLMEGKPFITERGDQYYYQRSRRLTFIYADRPVSLFGKLGELMRMGYYYFALDISQGPWDLNKELPRLLSGFKHERDDEPFSVFNWDRKVLNAPT
ncbi:MAG: U32 family peptidase [Thermodesulforhabdaceae bacterium]